MVNALPRITLNLKIGELPSRPIIISGRIEAKTIKEAEEAFLTNLNHLLVCVPHFNPFPTSHANAKTSVSLPNWG